MISKVTRNLATEAGRILALCCCYCLLLVPNSSNVYSGVVAQLHYSNKNNQQHFLDSIMADPIVSPQLFNGQYHQTVGNLIESNDASFVSDLMNSFSERQPMTQSLDQSNQHQHGTPGHYEFEVAPKMEPPSAPRPPFKQANFVCPGSGKCT